jgi:multiple sugar transport system permease protein
MAGERGGRDRPSRSLGIAAARSSQETAMASISRPAGSTDTAPPRWRALLGRDFFTGYLFVLPVLLFILGLIAYPTVYGIYISMTSKIIGRPEQFVGLDNYISLWEDRFFRQAVATTLYYTFLSIVFKLGLGMGLALLLNQRIAARNVLTGIILLPWVAPPVVVAHIWNWMYEPTFGALNYILVFGLGINGVLWLADPNLAMPSVIAATVWRGFPFFAVMLLAGLKGIPNELYEAAAVDGANILQRFRHVTLPGLQAVLLVVILLQTIFTFNDFTIIYNMTQGGPAGITRVYSLLTYEVAFRSLQIGKGVAISLTMAPVIVVIVAILARRMRRI